MKYNQGNLFNKDKRDEKPLSGFNIGNNLQHQTMGWFTNLGIVHLIFLC